MNPFLLSRPFIFAGLGAAAVESTLALRASALLGWAVSAPGWYAGSAWRESDAYPAGTSWAGRVAGRAEEVLHDPHDPRYAVVKSFVELWLPALILLLTSLLLILAALLTALVQL